VKNCGRGGGWGKRKMAIKRKGEEKNRKESKKNGVRGVCKKGRVKRIKNNEREGGEREGKEEKGKGGRKKKERGGKRKEGRKGKEEETEISEMIYDPKKGKCDLVLGSEAYVKTIRVLELKTIEVWII